MHETLELEGIETLVSCPVCGSTAYRCLPTPSIRIGSEYFREKMELFCVSCCKRCGLAYVNPRPSGAFLAGFYEQPGYAAHTSDHGVGYYASRIALLAGLAPGSAVLDIGCGGGGFMSALREVGFRVVGVEPSSQGRSVAASAGLEVYAHIDSLVVAGRTFDAIILWHVLEHVPDLRAFTTGIKQLLAASGVLIVAVPNFRSARSRVLQHFRFLKRDDDEYYRAFPIHLQGFSRKNIIMMINSCGLAVERTTTQHFGLDEIFCGRGNDIDDIMIPTEDGGDNSVLSGRTSLFRAAVTVLKTYYFAAHQGETLIAFVRHSEMYDTDQSLDSELM